MTYFFPFIAAVLISFILTFVVRKLGIKYGLVSKPRARDVHKKPVPRIGGLAIVAAFIIVSIFCFLILHYADYGTDKALGIDKHLLGFWLGGLLIALTMLLDDIFGLKAWQKLVAQILVVLIIISSGIGIDSLANPFGGAPINLNSIYIPLFSSGAVTYHFSLFSDMLTLVWLVGMMNIVNFIDGVDGLAGGVSTIAFLTIFALAYRFGAVQSTTAVVSIILAGSTLGFLIWNFPPAKIFMGDTGAMFLGFMLGVLPIISGGKLATVFLALGFPIVDGLYVATARIFRGQNPLTTPDKTHLHHRFLAAGYTPRQAIFSIYLISAGFAWVALRSSTQNKVIASVLLVILLFVIIRVLNLKAARFKSS